MVTHDLEDNNRHPLTRRTLASMRRTVDFTKHTLMVSDNGSCAATHALYDEYSDIISHVSYNGSNIGTANALNKLWRYYQPMYKAVCKIDNDVEWHESGWADRMVEVFERDPSIGICGLKRKDLEERPDHTNQWYRSKLRFLPHEKGQRWIVVESCNHIMGTVQAYRGSLIGDNGRFGYLWQMGCYGLDDSYAAVRMNVLGYESVFLHGFEIDHIDPGNTAYTQWKMDVVRDPVADFERIKQEYIKGKRPVFYDGGF